MTTPDEDDRGESFADLIGEVRPLNHKTDQTAPPAPNPSAASALRARSSLDAATDSPPSRFRWPEPEERRLAAAPGVSDRQLADLSRGHPEPEERIDLHGVRSGAAARLITRRLESAVARGLRCVWIVHGQGKRSDGGRAILRDQLPGWLTDARTARSVRAFAPAPTALGGAGATLVLLEKPD